MVGWNNVQSSEDVSKLMNAVECFHDWYLAGFSFDSLGRASADNLNLSCDTHETDLLTLTFRYDSADENGAWPELEMQFTGVVAMKFNPADAAPFHACNLQKTARGWVFCNDGALSAEEIAKPTAIDANILVVSQSVKWRHKLAHLAHQPQVGPSTTEHDEIYAKLLDEHFAEKYPDLFAANK
jgi:hypothetical protein